MAHSGATLTATLTRGMILGYWLYAYWLKHNDTLSQLGMASVISYLLKHTVTVFKTHVKATTERQNHFQCH
jgi:hypothetical protein